LWYYTEFFPHGLVFNPNAKDILFAGGGGFTGPKYFLNSVPDMNVDVVEIDPVVIEAAKTHFYVPEDNPRLKIFNYDARDFLTKTSDSKYDIIVLDAYSKNYVPFHLMTLQYYELLYKRMQPNGVVISNQIGTPDGEATSDLYRAVYKTMRQVFPNVYILPTAPELADELQNIILVATKSKTLHSNQDIRAMQQNYEDRIERSDSTSDELSGRIEFANFISDIRNINFDDVPIITDQLAPVEMLLNPITSEPYNVGAEVPTNQRVDPFSIQGNSITFVLPFVLIILWGIYMRYMEKRTNGQGIIISY
jgi:spermidine synthase